MYVPPVHIMFWLSILFGCYNSLLYESQKTTNNSEKQTGLHPGPILAMQELMSPAIYTGIFTHCLCLQIPRVNKAP